MLRRSRLTTYGFSVLGERIAQAATIIFSAAGLLTRLSIAGFVHALLTPKSAPFAGRNREGPAGKQAIRGRLR
jgi:hypothetical protein